VVNAHQDYRVIAITDDTLRHLSYPLRAYKKPYFRAPYQGTPLDIPGTVEAEDYDIGGEMLTYHDLTPRNGFGDYRPEEAVDVNLRDDGGYQVYAQAGEWLEYTVDVKHEGTYLVTGPVATRAGGGSFRIRVGNRSSSYMEVLPSGSWQNTREVSTVMNLNQGEQVMRLSIGQEPSFNIDKVTFSLATGAAGEENRGMQLYPNPVHEVLYLDVEDAHLGGQLRIFSPEGRLVWARAVEERQLHLPLANLEPGLYLVYLESRDGLLYARFIKA
jgi:hypothetical protein